MKLILIIFGLSLLILLVGCQKGNNTAMEITDKLDNNYKSVNQLDKIPIYKKTLNQEDQNKIIQLLEKEGFNRTDKKKGYDEFIYLLYVNENGSIDKVMIVEGMGDKYDNILINSMKSWKFELARMNGEKVKFRMLWKYHPYLENKPKDNFLGNLPTSIKPGDYNINFDTRPEIIGSIEDFAKRIQYPEAARESGIEGRVFIKAFIDEKGNVISTEIVRGVSRELDSVAAKAIKETKFTPGKIKGKSVKVQIIMPIMFKIK